MREIVAFRRLFFSLFKVPCASPQVGPLDRSTPLFEHKIGYNSLVWEIKPPFLYLVGVIEVGEFNCATEICAMARKIRKFSIFSPKNLKNCITAYTRPPFKIRARCLHQTGGFRGRRIELQIYPWLTLVAMVTNHCYLNTKLALTRLIQEICPQFLHQTGGFQGSPFPVAHTSCRLIDRVIAYLLSKFLLPW